MEVDACGTGSGGGGHVQSCGLIVNNRDQILRDFRRRVGHLISHFHMAVLESVVECLVIEFKSQPAQLKRGSVDGLIAGWYVQREGFRQTVTDIQGLDQEIRVFPHRRTGIARHREFGGGSDFDLVRAFNNVREERGNIARAILG